MKITTLFLDIGGVLLTNGWDHASRELAAKTFDLDIKDMQQRHSMTFDTYEVGKITLEEYLSRVVFYQKRNFTRAQFKKFMFDQSKPYPKMIELICELKTRYKLKIAVVSNEGRELNTYRIQKFKLDNFVDVFISSCFVHFRKPDSDIFKLALDTVQVPAQKIIYIEDRPMFVDIAETLGIQGICHKEYTSTREQLASYGLKI